MANLFLKILMNLMFPTVLRIHHLSTVSAKSMVVLFLLRKPFLLLSKGIDLECTTIVFVVLIKEV